MVGAVGDLIEAGRVKLYCVDSFDSESWSNRDIPLEERARRHRVYESWILDEVVPFVRWDCGGASEVITCGVSLGAFHAANFALKRADVFPLAICMSGNYDPSAWDAWGERGDATYFNNPMDYVAHLGGDHLDWLRGRVSLLLVCGQGQWEDTTGALESTRTLRRAARVQGHPLRARPVGARRRRTIGRPGARSSPIICHASLTGGETTHLIGLLLGTEDDWPTRVRDAGLAARADHRRLRPHAPDRDRADHDGAVRPARPAALRARDRPARVLVLPPARVVEEGRADERRVPAEQPVHVPVDGEARRLLRDDPARAEGAADGAGPAQGPAGQLALPVHRLPLQPAVRPARDRRGDRLPAVHEALRRWAVDRGQPRAQPRPSSSGPTTRRAGG